MVVSHKTKIEIRNVRKDFLDVVKKLKSSISEDDVRRMSKEVSDAFRRLNRMALE